MGLWELFFGFSDDAKAKHPHLFVNRNIDRYKCHRVVPMKVLCLSMGRTGTNSLKSALEQLGYPTSHGFDLHENPNDGYMWKDAIDAKWYGRTDIKLDRAFWDKLLGHVSACTDFPANMFGPELIAAYPEAQVILVERDVDRWYPSFEAAVISTQEIPVVTSIIGALEPKVKKLAPLVGRGMMRGQFQSADGAEWRRKAKQGYKAHYASIRAELKDQPDRLLNFKLDEGWGPLSEFLGVPVPKTPFPRVNEAAQHEEMMEIAVTQMSRTILIKLFLYTAPIVAVVTAWWRR